MLFELLLASTIVGPTETVTNCIAEATTESGIVSIGEDGELIKTGVGAWTIPYGALDLWNQQKISVKEGSVIIDADDTTRREAACPTDVLNAKALFWFDASLYSTKPELFTTRTGDNGKTFVDAMYDARETDPSGTRTRPYAVAEHVFRYVPEGSTNPTTSNNAEKILSPEIVTHRNRPSVWFGGVPSGRRMAIHRVGKSGVESTADVVHVFAVQDAPDSWGQVFAPGFRSTGVWTGTAEASWTGTILHCDEGTTKLGNRTFFNGVRKDGLRECPVKGYALFEVELTMTAVEVSRLYYNNAGNGTKGMVSGEEDKSRACIVQLGGGDYAYELIAFTNRLTGVERQRVVEYLKRKWFDATPGNVDVACAEGASCVASNDTPITNDCARTASSYMMAKAGTGDVFFERDTNDVSVQRGELSFASGRMVANRPVPVAVKSGMRYTVDYDEHYAATTPTADAAQGTVVKDGKGELLMRSIPSDIRTLRIDGGKVVFQPHGYTNESRAVASGDDIYVPIPNHSFEERNAGDETEPGIQFDSYCGWEPYRKVDWYFSGNYIYDVTIWTGDVKGLDNATRSDHGLNPQPPDGNSALYIRRDGGVKTTAALELEAGEYRLEYWNFEKDAILYFSLIDDSDGTEHLIAQSVSTSNYASEFRRHPVDFTLRQAGRYHLALFTGRHHGNNTGGVAIDDIRLRRLGPVADANSWEIPGGNMEAVYGWGDCTVTNRTFRPDNVHDNWTLTQPSGKEKATGLNLGVGFVNRRMFDSTYAYYNDSRYPYTSTIMTFTTNDALASTTFTPPAGTWYLKADMAENGDSDGKLSAVVNIGGSDTVLGSIKPNTRIFESRRYPTSFTVDGATPVTLKLSWNVTKNWYTGQRRATLHLDNLTLTQSEESDAEAGVTRLARYIDPNGWTCIGDAGWVTYANYPEYGKDPIGGEKGWYVNKAGATHINYNFNQSGTYRISIYVNKRSNCQGVNPLMVWYGDANGTETNVLGVIRCGSNYEIEHAFTFRIPNDATSFTRRIGVKSIAEDTKDEYDLSFGSGVLDNITFARVDDRELVAYDESQAVNADIVVGEHGKLDLNYEGTINVPNVRLGGRRVSGVISAERFPRYISGPGLLESPPLGTCIIFR